MNEIKETRKRITTFLGITFVLSSIFYFLMISAGRLGAGWGLYTMGLMWCPGIAAILSQLIHRRKLSELGWKWGKNRYQILSYATPFLYALAAYLIVWISRLGEFYDKEFVAQVARGFGWESVPRGLVILFYVLLAGLSGPPAGNVQLLYHHLTGQRYDLGHLALPLTAFYRLQQRHTSLVRSKLKK